MIIEISVFKVIIDSIKNISKIPKIILCYNKGIFLLQFYISSKFQKFNLICFKMEESTISSSNI